MPLCKCGCEKYFQAKRKNQLFFDDKHRDAWYKTNYFGQVKVTKTCLVCGEEFVTTCPDKQEYCEKNNNACRKEAQKRLKFGLDVSTPIVGKGRCDICGEYRKAIGKHRGLNLCLNCYTGAKFIDDGLAVKYIEAIEKVVTA
jgi:hypothetical protein